jgi:tetratricopeptide (TPR) repeat protein
VAGAPPDRGAAAALLAIAVAWCAQALFEWSWDIPAVTLPLFVALGTLAARPGRPAPAGARAPILAGVTAACVLYALSCALPAAARLETNAALAVAGGEQVSPGRLADAAAKAELAARLNPLATGGLLAAANIAIRRQRVPEASRDLLRAARRQPYDPEPWLQLTLTEGRVGNRTAARRAALRAFALDPRNDDTLRSAGITVARVLPANESATATGSPLPP